MILKELRLSRHISQEQLAQMSGLNVRTIQRIESGHNAGFELLKRHTLHLNQAKLCI